ncbi:acyl-CoA dehydrogenase family protein [Hyphomonas sp.]|uniref:acyl-CoA dehydrogenase family protein n=1 Tax=Hyphomonas sp. TaxID=87 RepID=UPI003F71343B
MNFDFSEDQQLVRDQTRRLLDRSCPPSLVRRVFESGGSHAPDVWRELCAFGVPATAVPLEHGGIELGYLDLCVVAEEIGRALAPVPIVGSRYMATEFLLELAPAGIRDRFLPLLASGELTATVATAPGRRPRSGENHGGKLGGSVLVSIDGLEADVLFVRYACGEAVVVELGQTGVVRRAAPSADPSNPQVIIEFADVDAVCFSLVHAGDTAWERTMARAGVLLAFQQLGGAQRALDAAVAYARERVAFGRQIGSFQAIKHMLADMYVAVELAKSNCYYGAWALSSGLHDPSLAGGIAHLSASDAYLECAKGNIQVHGGMGFTWESDCHLHYRRAIQLSCALGGRHAWRRIVARNLRKDARVAGERDKVLEACMGGVSNGL